MSIASEGAKKSYNKTSQNAQTEVFNVAICKLL